MSRSSPKVAQSPEAALAVLRRFGWIAWHGFRLVRRQRLTPLAVLLCLGLILAGVELRHTHFGGDPTQLLVNLAFAGLTLSGGLLAVAAPAWIVHAQLESGAAGVVLAGGVRRAEWLVGLWTGFALGLALLVAIAGAALALVLAATGGRAPAGGSVPVTPLLAGGVLQTLKLALMAALTLTIASYSRSALFTLLAAVAVAFVGHLQPVIADLRPLAQAWPARVALDLATWLPDLSAFDQSAPDLRTFLRTAASAGAYTAGCLGAAVVLFQRRDL